MTVLEIAAGEIGYTEFPPGSNNTKYNTAYYGQEVWDGMADGKYPWCMVFVWWCFAQAGHTLPYKTSSCSALLTWYQKNWPERIVTEPKPGDIIIYNFGHTGIFESDNGDTITAIEGNTSADDNGSQSNGGGVFRRTRRKKRVTAYIRPFDFESEDTNMDMDEFKKLWYQLRAELQDNDSGEWSREARDWAVNNGLIVGGDDLPDGSPNYLWEDLMTREQFVTVLYRFAKMVGAA